MLVIEEDTTRIPSPNGSSLYGNFRTRTFSQIYNNVEAFKEDYNNNGIPTTISDESVTTLYYLLYARFAHSSIASSDETQFKYKVFSIIFSYAPSWEKRLEIQKALRNLKEEDILKGSTAIYNSAMNPSTVPSTEELDYINSQNTTKYKKSKMDAYASLYGLIETDVTERLLSEFKKLFIKVVEPNIPLWYVTED